MFFSSTKSENRRADSANKLKLFQEWGRAVEGVDSSMIYLTYCKNLCKGHSVLPPSTTMKKKAN
jgi:hypothetical protein